MTRFTPYTTRHGSQPDFVPECTPSFTLEQHIASLHRDLSPERIAELYREWQA